MKHNILKIFFISLTLLLGVSTAWAKRYYFEVPEHWGHTESKVYKLRLYTGENNPNGWSRPLQKLEGSTNTYYYDNSGYTHVQFCQMKDGKESEIYISNTKYNTTRTAFPQTDDDETLLKVSNTIAEENTKDQYTQYEVADWDYPIFTAQNVHFLFHNLQNWTNPKLLIGTKQKYTICQLDKSVNTPTKPLLHFHIDEEIEFIGYTIINSDEPTGTFDGSFLDKAATYTQNTGRTKIYHKQLIGNIYHLFNKRESTEYYEETVNINSIDELNSTLTVSCEVSYDGGNTYVSTGTLPVDITVETDYFGENWNNADQTGKIELKKGNNIFQASTSVALSDFLTITPENYENYEFVHWFTATTNAIFDRTYARPHQMSNLNQDIEFILRLKRIEPNTPCIVTFNTDQLDNIEIPSQEVVPNTRATKPTVEVTNPGHICKWFTDVELTNEFDFDTYLINDITLYGAWVPEAEVGDYRLIYVEQVVEKDQNNHTVITRKKMHPSDIIKKRTTTGTDIVSLHVYNKNTYKGIRRYVEDIPEYYTSPSNSAVVLQQYNNEGQWVDIEHHMVFGPLEALPGHALLPGRQEVGGDITSIEDLIKQLRADYGIPNIVNAENHRYEGNGVWNFPIQQTVNGSNVTAELVREGVVPYTGTYYIRTANAKGGWNNYTIPANHMTFSEYQKSVGDNLGVENEEFTHYYCKRIELDKLDSKFVHFVVANDYAQAISDTLIADRADILGNPLNADQIIVGNNAELPENANLNIRFSWKEENNALHRAYISHAEADKTNFLLLNDINKGNLSDIQPFNYNDHNHYQTVLNAKPNATVSLTATYNSETQNLKGKNITLFEGNEGDKNTYPIHALYNFGENQISTFYLPRGTEFAGEDVAIETDVMIVRKNHEQANQLLLTDDARTINTGKTAYGALTFTYEHLSSNNWAAANDKTFYWISFPFDVKLSEAFGFGKYAVHWYIEYYDGKERAEKGLFLDSGTYWKYVTKSQAKEYILKANTGYVLWLNVPRIQSDGLLNDYNAKEITLFFPSAAPIQGDFSSQETTVNLPAYWRPEERRKKEDSNWHLIGVPSYANTKMSTTLTEQNGINFLYDYKPASDTYDATSTQELTYQSMFAYMVQHYGDIHWLTAIKDHAPSALAAKRNAAAEDKKMLRLELHRNGTRQDKTYIGLQHSDATTAFDMNKDLTKVINKTPNLYSITSDNVNVAGNVMPLAETIVPLGVDLQAASEYTFSMPDGTEGMVVELIDYETNTRTNLLLDNYTVTLPAGINETRFALSIKPDKVATSVENISDEATGVKKYIIDGNLYLQTDSALYDAQGHIVR